IRDMYAALCVSAGRTIAPVTKRLADRTHVAAARDRPLDRELGVDDRVVRRGGDAAAEFGTAELRARIIVHHDRRLGIRTRVDLPASTVVEHHADRADLGLGIRTERNARVTDANRSDTARIGQRPAGTVAEHGPPGADRINNDDGRIATTFRLAGRTARRRRR